jgi:hypothetical protein
MNTYKKHRGEGLVQSNPNLPAKFPPRRLSKAGFSAVNPAAWSELAAPNGIVPGRSRTAMQCPCKLDGQAGQALAVTRQLNSLLDL